VLHSRLAYASTAHNHGDKNVTMPPSNTQVKRFHLHLVSDSTGDTLHSVARACLSQFKNVEATEHFWNMIRSEDHLQSVFKGIESNRGLVLFTLVDDSIRATFKQFCHLENIPCIPVLEPVLAGFANYLGMSSLSMPGLQHAMDDNYFKRIDAMDFVLQNDDGQNTDHLEDAEVVLVGVSRTSKTPTSVYLGNRGVKTANVPLVPGITDLKPLESLQTPLVVALTESAKRLVDIRRNRLNSLNQQAPTHYTDFEKVEEEVRFARRFYTKMKWPVIDVTNRSVEETSAEIIKLLNKRKAKQQEEKQKQ
jgi:regulator of PEP synthase PpsR (kinase-PPPase family)